MLRTYTSHVGCPRRAPRADVTSRCDNAVATTFVFNTYLSSSAFGDPARESELLGAFTAVAGIVIAIVAPVAGQRTDASGHRKRWLAINSGVVALCFWHSISRLGVLGAQAGRVPAR